MGCTERENNGGSLYDLYSWNYCQLLRPWARKKRMLALLEAGVNTAITGP